MRLTAASVAILSLTSTVAAHGFITQVLINGKAYPGYDPWNGKYADGITQPWSVNGGPNADGPSLFRYTNSLLCQRDARPAQKSATAPAGSRITFHWSQWPEPHKGPILTYLAECGGDCSAVDNTQLKWFKIEEAGLLDASRNFWATDRMMEQGDAWNIQLPKNIKNGNYIMRHEMISLESTNSDDGLQFYPTCFNLEITGGSAQRNPEGVLLMEAYQRGGPGLDVGTKRTDPAVSSYTPPGPRIDSSIGATDSSMVNTGASSNGRRHIYPNSDHDPYATSGQSPNYDASSGKNTPDYSSPTTPKYGAPDNNTPTYGTPNNGAPNYGAPNNGSPDYTAPKQTPNTTPTTETGSRAGDANRKHCDDGYVKCREEQGRRKLKFKRGRIAARTPQDQSYRQEYCYQKWETCLNAALYGSKSQPTSNQPSNNYNQQSVNGYQQQSANGYQSSNGGYQTTNGGYQTPNQRQAESGNNYYQNGYQSQSNGYSNQYQSTSGYNNY